MELVHELLAPGCLWSQDICFLMGSGYIYILHITHGICKEPRNILTLLRNNKCRNLTNVDLGVRINCCSKNWLPLIAFNTWHIKSAMWPYVLLRYIWYMTWNVYHVYQDCTGWYVTILSPPLAYQDCTGWYVTILPPLLVYLDCTGWYVTILSPPLVYQDYISWYVTVSSPHPMYTRITWADMRPYHPHSMFTRITWFDTWQYHSLRISTNIAWPDMWQHYPRRMYTRITWTYI